MKKIIFTLAIMLVSATLAHAQGAFYNIDPEKFVTLLDKSQQLDRDNAIFIVKQTMKVMGEDPKSYRKSLEMATERLSDPTDSIHNEDLLIAVLQSAVESFVLSSNEKLRPQAMLDAALKNRIGEVATDINYVTPDGKQGNLLNNDNCYTLVYFNDPDCDACAKVKENLANSAVVKQAVDAGTLKVVAINPESNEKLWKKAKFPEWITNGWDKSQAINKNETYALPTLPVFFLLGRDNVVLLKNEASLKRIEGAITKVLADPDATSAALAKLLFKR